MTSIYYFEILRMHNFTTLLSLAVITIFYGCQLDDKKVNKFELNPSGSIGNGDSIYFSDDVWEIISNIDKLTVFDNKTQKAYWFNKNLELEKVVNKYGKGPGEYLLVYQAVSKNGYLILADEGKKQFHIFNDNGDWISSLTPPYRDNFLNNFAVDDSFNFYFSSRLGDSPIVKIDTLSNSHKDFIVCSDLEDFKKNHLNKYRVFLSKDDQLLAVGVSKPVINRFRLNGDLIETLDLSDFFKFRTERKEQLFDENPHLRKRMEFAYFNDVIYHDNKLYLLYIGDYEIPNSNQILVISDDNSSLSIDSNIDLLLEGAYFKRICIFNDKLIAFDRAAAELIVFDLNKVLY